LLLLQSSLQILNWSILLLYNLLILDLQINIYIYIYVICTLYSTICWNIVTTLLCSSNFASIPCTNPSVWNLGVWPLELVPNEPRLLCAVQTSPNAFVPI
jgi:hypothetical protein